ncbi:MAG: hypothetical protein UT77_C0001G0059 [Candidatus Daviesbacteria bacterium GW2011_GWC2_40_12]|uniref:Membrane protein 6-pyruvoyl-tetrahydropterin synthase-related domain-containing protein n=1 Tax=Candidatus Daviesbacteria bacterium GW2011_GWC2_40_12 TaxID=1618431 RepID=A0A0G0QR59_9BACT|nr:MAG: hypothetical protein UT04_C0030G0005 [Candidatus Daviesbacteria bacterium GW2011_GWF2_38_7]KKR17209.1 MAG: hypothetical protein UT45_C0002G0038 [Candidatus Daviesbacteria bacterium GW2011_GWA2_39_33]KKR42608.1 MAG: hypothetical protein UT77_C0001G0059 [Candidatus Daviesbacteria bacterium GW2011_GWC2_40_12]OGE30199.1 MAG: hypothetical protein A3C29_02220 [Candidatus Daviesbacteria bacterium RIFCSPHIGHO2_02_FULL_40_16]
MRNMLLKYWPILLILALSALVVWPLFLPGYFSHHDDLQVMRIFEMRKCIEDFQIPCRWVPDMGFGNGFPLFNYYGVFPYYIGAILSFAFGFIGAAKSLFFIVLLMGGITMYLLGEKIGGKWVGLTSGILYLFAPYRSLDAYVRGAISESFALAIIPLVFYFGLRLAKEKTSVNFIGLAISTGIFLITHNIMTMFFIPLLLLFIIYVKIFLHPKSFAVLILSIILGFGMSAFFLLPAFLEKNLVQTDNLTRFDLDFRVHFVTVRQLFLDRSWGYGASVLGSGDGVSFQIGWPHWGLVLLSLPLFFFLRKDKKILVLYLGILTIFLFSVFMTHNKSAFIWEKIGLLRYTQFPWRFLSLSIFSASLIGGIAIMPLNKQLRKYAVIVIAIVSILLNFAFFKPDKFSFDLTDSKKLSGELWNEQRIAGISDYLPVGAYQPREAAPDGPLVVEGEAGIKNFVNKSNYWQFDAVVKTSAKIELPVFDFPNWEVYINKRRIPHNNANFLRRIQFNLEPGSYKVSGKLADTPIRAISNIVSLLSFASLIFLTTYGKNKFKKL